MINHGDRGGDSDLFSTSSIAVYNRQRGIKIDITALQIFAERALRLTLESRAGKVDPQKLSQIDVILISDRRMSELHRRFFRIDGPTDVITFQHGEIFVSVETARRHARSFKNAFKDELQMYLVHGLLHLRGFDDKSPKNAQVMRARQARIAREASKGRRAPARLAAKHGRFRNRSSLKR